METGKTIGIAKEFFEELHTTCERLDSNCKLREISEMLSISLPSLRHSLK